MKNHPFIIAAVIIMLSPACKQEHGGHVGSADTVGTEGGGFTDTAYFSQRFIDSMIEKYGLHDRGLHYHFPRRSFLKEGYRPPGGYVKDFSMIEKDGRWHITHIDGRPGEICWVTGNEIHFSHASSTDLDHWMRHRMAFYVGDRAFENRHVWAPYIVSHQGSYHMFYMGRGDSSYVLGSYIFHAYSEDMETWQRGPMIWEARGKDPMVFAYQGRYYLIYTSGLRHAVAACVSDDLEDWEQTGDIYYTEEGGAKESPAVHRRADGKWVLWFNNWSGPEGQYVANYIISDNPLHFEGQAKHFGFSQNNFGPEQDKPEYHEFLSSQGFNGKPAPGALELVKTRGKQWLVAYFRPVHDHFVLHFGELDWTREPAYIREIHDAEEMEAWLKK